MRQRWQPRLLPPAPPRPPVRPAPADVKKEDDDADDTGPPPIIWALGGVSGSGKSAALRNHVILQTLPVFDIGDVYKRFEAAGQACDYTTARHQFFMDAALWLNRHPKSSLVLEAFFNRAGPNRTTPQRDVLDAMARGLRREVRYVWFAAPRDVCRQRVLGDAGASEQRTAARLSFVNGVADCAFEPIPEEAPELVLDVGNMMAQRTPDNSREDAFHSLASSSSTSSGGGGHPGGDEGEVVQQPRQERKPAALGSPERKPPVDNRPQATPPMTRARVQRSSPPPPPRKRIKREQP